MTHLTENIIQAIQFLQLLEVGVIAAVTVAALAPLTGTLLMCGTMGHLGYANPVWNLPPVPVSEANLTRTITVTTAQFEWPLLGLCGLHVLFLPWVAEVLEANVLFKLVLVLTILLLDAGGIGLGVVHKEAQANLGQAQNTQPDISHIDD